MADADKAEEIAKALTDVLLHQKREFSPQDLIEMIDAILALIEARDAWRPIESAPRDGRPVLGWDQGTVPGMRGPWGWSGVQYVTWCRAGEDREDDSWVFHDATNAGGARHHWYPTHWLPLPSPPQEQSK